jgi:hypothetical protein
LVPLTTSRRSPFADLAYDNEQYDSNDYRCYNPINKPTMPDDTSTNSWKDGIFLKVRDSTVSHNLGTSIWVVFFLIYLPSFSATPADLCLWSPSLPCVIESTTTPPDCEYRGIFPVPWQQYLHHRWPWCTSYSRALRTLVVR